MVTNDEWFLIKGCASKCIHIVLLYYWSLQDIWSNEKEKLGVNLLERNL